jgi:carbamoyltransferase
MLPRISLGIHIGHDRGAALVREGELVAQMSEERLDRIKHSNSPKLPYKSIRAVLKIAGTTPDRLGSIGLSYTNVVIADIIDQLSDEIREFLNLPDVPIYGIGHHDCHAWSAYYTSDFNNALILVADGAGDIIDNKLESESLYVGKKNHLKLVERRLQDFGNSRIDRRNSFNLTYMSEVDRVKQISLGRKYEQFTYLIGFGHGHAGKTMALASYADPLFKKSVEPFNGLDFSLTFDDGLVEIDKLWRKSGEPWHRFIHHNSQQIAAAGQYMLEAYALQLVKKILLRRQNKNLCAAGGLFLNCQLNQRILKDTKVSKLHVIPSAGDDGQCVGAALAAFAQEYVFPNRNSSALPYLGKSYSDREIEKSINHFKLRAKYLKDETLTKQLARDIAGGLVIGFLRGRSEIGPRALCHRSILADPRRKNITKKLNLLKRRELFRPFAPVVVSEAQFTYFDLAQDSPYMLLAAEVRPEYRKKLPGITHIDSTARVQSVAKNAEPFVYGLLKAFESETGFPVLINTSFNIAGDPMVEAPHDAIVTFLNSEIDILVMENYYIKKRKRPAVKKSE